MRRREFTASLPVITALASRGGAAARDTASGEGKIMTVLGPIAPQEAGAMLTHEHLMSTFGADGADEPNYDAAKVLAAVVPYLEMMRKLGCGAIAECTTVRFGRSPELLREISKKTGMHILTNSGYYGAANDRYVPAHAYSESADQLAARWLKEWRDGIDGTGIRPGFLKIGIDAGPLSPVDRKLVLAAARTHLGSGLTMAIHTGNNPGAVQEQLAILSAEGVSPEAWVWVHADTAPEDALLDAARRGAWISFDKLSASSPDSHLDLLRMMKRAGRLSQVLLSHDGEVYPIPSAKPRPFDVLFRQFVPTLRGAGFTEDEVQNLIARNPQRAFTIRIRRQG